MDKPGAEAAEQRAARIKADTPRLWGEMDAARMFAHLRRSIEISLGEYEAKDESSWFSRTVMRWVAFHVMRSWPKGKLKSPDYFTPSADAGEFEAERAGFIEALGRFMAAAEEPHGRMGYSPVFGSHPLGYWRRIHGMHIDHHLRQFGV